MFCDLSKFGGCTLMCRKSMPVSRPTLFAGSPVCEHRSWRSYVTDGMAPWSWGAPAEPCPGSLALGRITSFSHWGGVEGLMPASPSAPYDHTVSPEAAQRGVRAAPGVSEAGVWGLCLLLLGSAFQLPAQPMEGRAARAHRAARRPLAYHRGGPQGYP